MNGERAAKGLRPFPPRPFGRYTLLAPLAMGGMGEIFLGRMEGAQGFEKWVVIKKILPQLAQEQDFVDRFVTEAKILVKLHHGSVGQVLDMGQIDEDYYIALEFVDGKDLRKVASRCKERNYPLPQGLALYVMGRVVDALAYAHRKKGDDDQDLNLVHRDVSPQNVLVSYEGEVKVIDFGLAKSSLASGRTSPSMILGKFFYMSPEQAQHGMVDRRSDLYAAGIVLYELLAGKNPFDSVPQAEIITRVAHPRIEPLGMVVPGLSPSVEAVVMKALAVDPKDRFANAEEMRGRLMAAMLEVDPGAGPESMAQFMRAVFATEYAQERKVFSSLREAAQGSAAAAAATSTKPRLVTQGESAVQLKSPSSAVTTTVSALPSASEEFSFPVTPAVPAAQRSTDPARQALSLPELPELSAALDAAAAQGHTVPFAALPVTVEARAQSSLPILPAMHEEPAASADSDPQEWLAPASSASRSSDAGHTVPFAALPADFSLAGPAVTIANPMPAAPPDSGPSPVPTWAAKTLAPGSINLTPTPSSLTTASTPAAPPPSANVAPRPAPRTSSKSSLPKIPVAPKAAPVSAPSVVIADDLLEPAIPSSRPTMQVNALDLQVPPASVSPTGLEHVNTSPVLLVAPNTESSSALTLPPVVKRPSANPSPIVASATVKQAPSGAAMAAAPPAAVPKVSKTGPHAMTNTRAAMYVLVGGLGGLAILALLFALLRH